MSRRRQAGGIAIRSALLLLVPAAAVWAGPVGVTWQAPIEVATGDAWRGPWRMNDSEFRYVDDPTVVVDAAGTVGVAWVDNARQDIRFKRYGRDGEPALDRPTDVSRSPDIFSWLPRMALDPADPETVYILWQEIIFSGGSHGGEILFARSTDGGVRFSEPLNLSNTTAGAGKGRLTPQRWDNGSLDIAVAADGTLHVAWTEYEGALRVSRSIDGGTSFSAPRRIAGGAGRPPARAPALAVAGDEVYLAWTVGDDAAADIHISHSDDAGESFAPPRVVHETDGHSDAPKIGLDGAGTLHLVHAERPAGFGQHYRIHYTHSRDGAKTFATPQVISGAAEGAHYPALQVIDDAIHVLWESFPEAGRRPRGLMLTCAPTDTGSFVAPAKVPGSDPLPRAVNGSLQGLLMNKLAVDATGGLAVVNSTFDPNVRSEVRLFRGRLAGCTDASVARWAPRR